MQRTKKKTIITIQRTNKNCDPHSHRTNKGITAKQEIKDNKSGKLRETTKT